MRRYIYILNNGILYLFLLLRLAADLVAICLQGVYKTPEYTFEEERSRVVEQCLLP